MKKSKSLSHLRPHCLCARKAIEELKNENASYQEIRVRWIEESNEAELADSRDYFCVPTIFYRGEKLNQATATKRSRSAFKLHLRSSLSMNRKTVK